MSERSSESSCEWIILNENEDDIPAEDINQSFIQELSYEALSNAVSDSIRSSLTSEELEWQYEVFDDSIRPQGISGVEDLEPVEFHIENAKDSNVEAEDDNSSLSSFIDEYERDECSDLAPSQKILSYKHDRNDRLNFILNLLLALAISSAVGLGTGHFLGWSQKCYKSSNGLIKDATEDNEHVFMPIKQNFEDKIKNQEQKVISHPALNPISCSNLEDGSISTHQEISTLQPSDNIILDTALTLPENSMYMSSDVLKLKKEGINNNYSDSAFPLGFVTDFDLSEISSAEVSIETVETGSSALLPVGDNDYLFFKDEVNNIQQQLSKEFYSDDLDSAGDKMEEKTFGSPYKFPHENKEGNLEFNFFKQFDDEVTDTLQENNLTNHLKNDLNQVIQSLTFIITTRLIDFDEKYTAPEQDSEAVVEQLNDFQNLINERITDIDTFVLSSEYKSYDKFSVKYLKKMVYSLVDAVDHLMKISFKTLNRRNGRIKAYKFSNNIAKVFFNFNKKWEKNNSVWVENSEKFKVQGFAEKSFKGKNRHWKKHTPVENSNYKKNKFRRHAMKF